ncbi:hypothetical protein AC579_2765 [Pseudocercospora musae]|uniref:Glycosyltransferase family 31 protein n=1 Tax=Pseudocercospora musae TaxID=113226 RepID=A0A139II71_9PEZI|nr:hypothetical protein AC579_2765 [Pseudocercospora musae]
MQVIAAATLVLLSFYFLLTPSGIHRPLGIARWQRISAPLHAPNITLDIEILKQLEVPAKFSYQRHCISARERNGLTRESLVEIQDPVFAGARPVDISLDDDFQPQSHSQSILPPCQTAVEIDVPEFSSHVSGSTEALMLGVATTLKRIEQSLPTFSRWLSNTGSPLLVLLVDHADLSKIEADLQRVRSQAEALRIELIFEDYQHTFEHDSEGLKNFGLATALDKHRRESTQWFGIIDDDTFFLSLPHMLDALQPFDQGKKWYIGALTEGHTRVAKEGFKAWGGAGFFISPPLMRTLAENAVECTPLDKFFGDILWRDCIMEVTSPTVHLTELRGLNQMDLWNDLSGWYEAGFSPILTVHHWKSWHFYPVAMAHIVSDVAGPDSFLQRYLFGNSTVLTNGYSISEYPTGLPDLNLVELTMTEDVNVMRPPPQLEFHHSMGHTRPALELGRDKIQWKFKHSVISSEGTVRQFYVKNENDQREASVIEVDWSRS